MLLLHRKERGGGRGEGGGGQVMCRFFLLPIPVIPLNKTRLHRFVTIASMVVVSTLIQPSLILWECVRRRLNFYTDTLNDFPSWLSISKNQPFFINHGGFTERYSSDKVHAILKKSRYKLRCVTALTSLIGLKLVVIKDYESAFDAVQMFIQIP